MYGAGLLKSWRRTWSASNIEPDQVRRRSHQCFVAWNMYSIEIVAPYMVRIQYWSQTMYGAGRLKIVAPYLIRMP